MTEQEYCDQIYEKASKVQSKADLVNLLAEIESHAHDYGTIVYGCMAAMKGAFNYINRGKSGGITGFQAGCLGWECVREFLALKGPARLLDFENMLYPQYGSAFEKVITPEIWEHIQNKAKTMLAEDDESPSEVKAHEKVRAHWSSIAAGELPFGFQIGEL